MAYEEKTDWLPDDPINEDDVNRWEKGIKDSHTDLAAHKNDMNNPHNTTKAQIGLSNVDDVKQAAKKDFDQHNQDQDRHITKDEREKWDGGQLSKFTKDNGAVLLNISDGVDFHKVAVSQYKTFTFYTANSGINTPPQSTRGIYLHSSSTYGEAIALANDGGIWRKSLVGGNWSDWIRFETEKSVQEKVDAHAKNTSIHVTQTDKDKWNGSQLTKITNDYGGIAFSVNAGEDMLQAIINRGRGMGTFYAIGTAVNSPSEASTRGFYQMTSQDADGKGMYGWVYAMDYKNNVFTNYYDGNKVGWQGWNKLDTENAAQMRIEKAVSDAKDYTDSNFSNEKLMVLPIASGIEDARIAGTEYPFGITLMKIYDNNQTGYPLGYGLIKNEKWNNARFTQYFYGNADSRNGKNYLTGTWIRHWWLESGWTPWEKISGFAHANIGTTGRQTLKKAEQNKILYNRVIIDSHGAFDISNNRFIAPNDGMYLIGGGAYVETIATYTNLELQVFRNGSFYKSVQQFRNSDGQNTDSRDLTISCGGVTVPLKKGDYVELYIYCGYSGDVTRYIGDKNGQYNYFDIAEIGGKVY
ncbi:terminase [Bacillus atrophaeus]|uniref:terminase n=1 Tax=Bacillus atrophaeus TaxID=1452 RepID=UPI0022807481|nr:terminase [Bacillus atrophaeus]MCY8496005.1 terminase [Bacillus atrophaeus]MCY8812750.1 terminase [Bacillus atrophaeus]MCY8819487.1 terminase [Bacillus atrophaeus]MCY8828417.1 terminase [Bacillus atrophaeus]MCY8833866.1 terminase [Bacillus atrophaeus]